MKDIIKNYMILAVSVLFAIFCINYVWNPVPGDALREQIGSILENVKEKDVKSEGHVLLKEMSDVTIPNVKYIGGTKHVGDSMAFKEMFEVGLCGDNYKSGAEEDGFYIYFEDMQDRNGNSVVTYLDSKDIEILEEIPTAFILDREQEILYFHKSGIFIMYVKIYTTDGNSTTYECIVPVEVS